MVGRYGEALERLDAALACFQRDGQAMWIAVAANHKAQFLIDLGQFARARQALGVRSPRGRSRAGAPCAYSAPHRPRARPARRRSASGRCDRRPRPRRRPACAHACAARPGRQRSTPTAAVQRCDEVLQLAGTLEFAGVAMNARLLRACAEPRRTPQRRRTVMRELLPQCEAATGRHLPWPTPGGWPSRSSTPAATATRHLRRWPRAPHWVRRVALPQVPDEFRDSFLQRNPSNRALLAAADRRLAQ